MEGLSFPRGFSSLLPTQTLKLAIYNTGKGETLYSFWLKSYTVPNRDPPGLPGVEVTEHFPLVLWSYSVKAKRASPAPGKCPYLHVMKLRPSSLGKPLSRVQAGYWPEPRSADPQAVVFLPFHSASKANTRAADWKHGRGIGMRRRRWYQGGDGQQRQLGDAWPGPCSQLPFCQAHQSTWRIWGVAHRSLPHPEPGAIAWSLGHQ